MQILYFTVVAIALYFGADWILQRIERARGERLPHRNLVFFAVLLGMALVSFALIRQLES